MDFFGIWVAGLLTISILSFLYKDNPLFRVAESIYTGVSLGYYIGMVVNQTLKPNLFVPLATDFTANWHLVFAALIGAFLYSRFIPRIAWLARWGLSAYVGYYVGINMVQKLQGEVLPQTRNTLLPLNSLSWETFNNAIVIAGVISVLVYFYFSREHKGTTGKVSRLGVWYLMVSFGAAFGYTVMARISLLIGRMNFLITDWIGGTISRLSGM